MTIDLDFTEAFWVDLETTLNVCHKSCCVFWTQINVITSIWIQHGHINCLHNDVSQKLQIMYLPDPGTCMC